MMSLPLPIVLRVLAHSGYEALAAPDAEAAINLCRQHKQAISLAPIDFMMAGTDGPATVASLREVDPSIQVAM
jgi:CheY-like chemotaxis protein